MSYMNTYFFKNRKKYFKNSVLEPVPFLFCSLNIQGLLSMVINNPGKRDTVESPRSFVTPRLAR